MQYNFDEVINRYETNCGKWDFMSVQNKYSTMDTLPFWVADMDFQCPQGVIDALHKRVDNKIFGYSVNFTGDYFRSVCGWFQHRFDWFVNSSDVFYCSGIVPALGFLVNIMSHEGEQVLIQSPVYRPFRKKIEANHRVVISNDLIEKDGKYEIDFEDFERKVKDPKTTLFILCSPHNPIGKVWTEEELIKMAKICFENGVRIISDEIHHDIVNKNCKHIPLAKLFPEEKEKIVTCTAVSKTFNLAGMAYSNIVIHDKNLQELWKVYVQDNIGTYLPNPLSIKAVQAAYATGEEWLEQVNEYIWKNLEFAKAYLAENLPKAIMEIPEGTYFAWVNIGAYLNEEAAADIDSYLVKNGDVLIEGGSIFGENSKDYIRFNVACPRTLLEEGLRRVCAVLKRLNPEDILPDFKFNSVYENQKSIHEEIDRPTFLVFLRYYGCTLCQLDIHNFIQDYEKIVQAGAKMILVLQSEQGHLQEQLKEKGLPFEVICDDKQELYDMFGIQPALKQERMINLEAIQKLGVAQSMGFEHGKYEGNELQLPATFLIDENKMVVKAHYGANVGDVPTVDQILQWL